ncbi:beta-catenin-like protein 1 isoform X2 [Carassius gibelio]|uniref:beta-catenin-like protein 1 isoform X2 n=1 Tax=Carassius gibelio TaxID=101364 RepID=UPI00227946AA|nr:beta-catenin-like protein 1 isoform X2 [Carassius gibelio]
MLVMIDVIVSPQCESHISIVVDLLQELTDIDTLHESEGGPRCSSTLWPRCLSMPVSCTAVKYWLSMTVLKHHNPATPEEQEMMENLFDTLCSCLMLPANRDRFLRGAGLQLMNLMLREKKMSRVSDRSRGVRYLQTTFSPFMKMPKKMKIVGISDKKHEKDAENIGDGKSEEFKESEQKRILELLENPVGARRGFSSALFL